MESTAREQSRVETGMDQAWLREWVDFGLAELAAYLRLQAAFSEYCARRAPLAESA